MGNRIKKASGPPDWSANARLIERARIVLALSLAKRPPGDVVRIVMDWLEDAHLHEFCRRYLDDSELKYIERI